MNCYVHTYNIVGWEGGNKNVGQSRSVVLNCASSGGRFVDWLPKLGPGDVEYRPSNLALTLLKRAN